MNRFTPASMAALVVYACTSASSHADDFFQTIETTSAPAAQSQHWRQRGYIQQDFKYGWQAPDADSGLARQQAGISQVKTHAFTQFSGAVSDQLNWRLSAKGESQWYQWQEGDGQWRNHKNQLRVRDAWVDINSDQGLWLRLGQQVLPWGEAEGLTVLDVFSPQDLREPGQAELQDIREPVPAAQLTVPLSTQWRLTALSTYRARSNRYAGEGEAFDPFANLRAQGLDVDTADPETSWEVGARLTGQFHGGDLVLMWARFNDRDLTLTEVHPEQARVVLGQIRQSLVGLSANRVLGSWLVRSELALRSDVPQMIPTSEPWPTRDETRASLGAEYSGWHAWLVSVELNGIHTTDHHDAMLNASDRLGQVVRMQHNSQNDRLINQLWLINMPGSDGQMARWDLRYDLSDHWELGLTLMQYRNNEPQSLFYPFRHNDSINAQATFSF